MFARAGLLILDQGGVSIRLRRYSIFHEYCPLTRVFVALPLFSSVIHEPTILVFGAKTTRSAPSACLSNFLAMDPLTTFSVACGVIQVIDFSSKTLMTCREIYKEGSLSDYRSLENLAKHLIDTREKLDTSNDFQITADNQSLIELSEKCSTTADQLVERLQALKIQGPHKRRQAILKTVRLLRERGEIEKIQKRLDQYRISLDTQILVSLRSVRSNI